MTVVLPLTVAPAGQALASSRTRPALLVSLVAAGQVFAHALGALRMLMRAANEPRLSEGMKRDIGLLPEQNIDAPIWGTAGIMWRV